MLQHTHAAQLIVTLLLSKLFIRIKSDVTFDVFKKKKHVNISSFNQILNCRTKGWRLFESDSKVRFEV